MDRKQLSALSRTELQWQAKQLGIKGNLKSDKLIEEILEVEPKSQPPPDDEYDSDGHQDKGSSQDSEDEPVTSRRTGRRFTNSRANATKKATSTAQTRSKAPEERFTSLPKRVARKAYSTTAETVTSVPKRGAPATTGNVVEPEISGDEELDTNKDSEKSPPRVPKRAFQVKRLKSVTKSSTSALARGARTTRKRVTEPENSDVEQPEANADSSEVEPASGKPVRHGRPSLTALDALPYIDLSRRESASGDAAVIAAASPSPTAAPNKLGFVWPKPASKASPRRKSTKNSNQSALVSAYTSSAPLITNTGAVVPHLLATDEIRTLKTKVDKFVYLISELQTDLATERARSALLQEKLETFQASRRAAEEAFEKRLDVLEFQASPSAADMPKATDKLKKLEESYAVDQLITSSLIESHTNTVKALEQYARGLEARIKKLETAAAPPTSEVVYEIGTPPAPRIGKRDRVETPRDGDTADGEDPPAVPGPAKRPRFESLEGEEHFAQQSLQSDLQEESMLARLVSEAGAHTMAQITDTSSPASGSAGGTVDPSVLTKSAAGSGNRPISGLRRNSSQSSTPAKMIRTSYVSFGQGLPLPAGGGGFGSPASTSTPTASRKQDAALSIQDVSMEESSFSAFRPAAFSFGRAPQASPPAERASAEAAAPESPTFSLDAGPRPSSGDYDDGEVFTASSPNQGSPSPLSPSKSTMYGTELSTPLRREMAAERGASKNGFIERLLSYTSEDEEEIADEEQDLRRALQGPDGHSRTPPRSEARLPSLENTSPSKYGLDNPFTWGGRPKP